MSEALRFFRHFTPAQLAGLAESHDGGNIEGAGTHATLVTAAIHLRGKLHARTLATDVKSPDTFGAVKLVTGERHQVDIVLNHVDGDLSNRLYGIGVKQYATL